MNMKLVLLLLSSIAVGCGNLPVKPTDICVQVELSRKYVYNNAERRVKCGEYIVTKTLEAVPVDGIPVMPIIAMFYPIEYMIRSLPGTNVYVWPEGNKDYRQEIIWSKNRVYVPKYLEGRSFRFCIEMDGVYIGTGYEYVDRDKEIIELEE